MKKLALLLIFLMLNICACYSVEPSKIGKDHADKMSTSLTYFKDQQTGLCFAAVASREKGKLAQSGIGLTCVPCESLNNN